MLKQQSTEPDKLVVVMGGIVDVRTPANALRHWEIDVLRAYSNYRIDSIRMETCYTAYLGALL